MKKEEETHPSTAGSTATSEKEPLPKRGACVKCIAAWCKSVQYLQWTILVLSMLLICLIVVAVFVDLHHAVAGPVESHRSYDGRQIEGAEVSRILCPNRWLLFDEQCYYFSSEKKTWKLSKDFCSVNQAHLAVIVTPATMNVLQRYKTDASYWIGLTKEGDGWKWESEYPFCPSLFPLTEHGSAMKCAHLYMGKAEAAHCDSLKRWICIKPIS